jgi:hypothetical protein
MENAKDEHHWQLMPDNTVTGNNTLEELSEVTIREAEVWD